MNPQEIKDLRLEKKLTQERFGDLLGTTKASVSRWEKGKSSPSGAAMKILNDIKNGDIIITELTDLEVKLLDQNVQIGNFEDREDYLTQSLKYLLTNGSFMPLTPENITPLPQKKAHIMAAAGSGIEADVIDWNGTNDTVHVKVCGDSMTPKFKDGDIINMKHKKAARSPYMKKGLIYLVQLNDQWLIKEYGTRKARADEEDALYLTSYGTVGILKSINSAYQDIDITGDCDWFAWYE